MEQKHLCVLFGTPPGTLSRSLRKAEAALSAALSGWDYAAFKWPTKDQQREWGVMVAHRYPLITKRWGFVDGKNYPVQEPTNADTQNAMYNGWLHSVFVTGTLLFGVDGCIAWGQHNCPGSWNDATTSRRMQEKIWILRST
jgi:hypothetical protein